MRCCGRTTTRSSVIPNYQSVESVPLSICETTGMALDPARNWELDLDQVRDAIRPNTRVISLQFSAQSDGEGDFARDAGCVGCDVRASAGFIFSATKFIAAWSGGRR